MNKNNNIFISEPENSVFKDREKEAKFWEENFDKVPRKAVKIKFSRNLSATLNIRLDPRTINSIRSRASKKGLGPSQLIRMWIMEKINGKNYQSA